MPSMKPAIPVSRLLTEAYHEGEFPHSLGHFMPLGLLDSQLTDLQPPGPEEAPFIHDIAQPAEALSDSICREWQRLSRSGAATPNS